VQVTSGPSCAPAYSKDQSTACKQL